MTALRNLSLSVLLWGLAGSPRWCGTAVLDGKFLGLVVVGVLEPGHEQLEFGPVRQLLLRSFGDEQHPIAGPLVASASPPAPAPAPTLSLLRLPPPTRRYPPPLRRPLPWRMRS